MYIKGKTIRNTGGIVLWYSFLVVLGVDGAVSSEGMSLSMPLYPDKCPSSTCEGLGFHHVLTAARPFAAAVG